MWKWEMAWMIHRHFLWCSDLLQWTIECVIGRRIAARYLHIESYILNVHIRTYHSSIHKIDEWYLNGEDVWQHEISSHAYWRCCVPSHRWLYMLYSSHYRCYIRNTSISCFLVALGNMFTATDIRFKELIVSNILLAITSSDTSYYLNDLYMLISPWTV